jgi:Flp pilus assembly pilin Flp
MADIPVVSDNGRGRRTLGVRPPNDGGGRMRAVRTLRRDEGQTMSEYAVVLAVITPAIIAALALLSERVASRLDFVRAFL